MHSLESIGRELRDLRGDLINVKRSMRHGRRDSQDEEAGSPLGDAFVAMACAAVMNGLGRPERAAEWTKRAVTNPAMTAVVGWAADLVSAPTTSFVLSLASGIRAVPAIMARAHGVPLVMNMRSISLNVAASASFLQEGRPIGVSKGSIAGNDIIPYTVKTLATFSEELGDHSSPVVEEVLRQILGDAVGQCVEAVFFSAGAQSISSPQGALVGATVVPPGASFAEDVRGLVSALGAPVDPIFIMSPARRASIAAAGGLIGFSDYLVLGSSAIDDDMMVALDADSIVFGAGTPSFKLGREATLVEQTQDTVGPISTPGTPVTFGSPTRSLWQTNTASMRVTLPISWVKAKPAATVTGISW